MYFSEIIKLQFGKKNAIHCFVFYFFFRIIVAKLSVKTTPLPLIFFLDSNSSY